MTKQIIKLALATLLFYAVGRLAYQQFYQFTISAIESFSAVPLKFFGKFPRLYFGDPVFGLIIASIPVAVFLTNLIAKERNKFLIKTSLIYAFSFTITYFFICWEKSQAFKAWSLTYKEGQELSYNLQFVHLNQLFLLVAVIATALTVGVLLLRLKTEES